jgi:hypothetical protein
MSSVTYRHFMLRVLILNEAMLSVIMLSVMAPILDYTGSGSW